MQLKIFEYSYRIQNPPGFMIDFHSKINFFLCLIADFPKETHYSGVTCELHRYRYRPNSGRGFILGNNLF